MKIKLNIVIHFLRNLGQTATDAENDGDKETSNKNSQFSRFCKTTINHQLHDSLAFQQHASGQFSAIKPCLGVAFALQTHPTLCNLAIVMGFLISYILQMSYNLCNNASIIGYRRMLLELRCLNTWLLAVCHIIFITYTILLLQTQIKVIPIKF